METMKLLINISLKEVETLAFHARFSFTLAGGLGVT